VLKFLLCFLFTFSVHAQSVKPPALPSITNADIVSDDLFLLFDLSAGITKKLPAGQLDLRYAPYSNAYVSSLIGDVTGTGPGATLTTIANGAINNAKVSASAAIAYSKLNLTGAILNADLAGSITAAKLVGSDIATVGTVTAGTWSATTIALNKGGTGQTTKSAAFDALSPMTTAGDLIYGGASGTGTRLAAGSASQFLKGGTTPSWSSLSTPTVQIFTSGTAATYTTPAGVLYLRIRLVGGGGGGAGGGNINSAGNGATGGTTSFNTSGGSVILSGTGGTGGQTGAVGGGPTVNSPAINAGSYAGSGNGFTAVANGVATYATGWQGANSPFGGGGVSSANTVGGAATANTGSGGGGGSTSAGNPGADKVGGAGGGSGGYVHAFIPNPSATYLYTIGGGGAGGAAQGGHGFNGGNGAAGIIIVEEYYQ
jgi:hypothetical protein